MAFDLTGTRIVFVNWRCPWHPLAGGAEWYCWNIATRFARAGAEVTLFTSRAAGLPAAEERSGVRIRRRGGTYTVYIWAALFLLARGHRMDAVVDCQNGIPFFAPLFLLRRSTAVVMVMHHVHQDQFAFRFRWPLSSLGRFLERDFSRWVYGRTPIVAVSPGTRADIRRRLKLRGPIYIVPNGVEKPDPARLPQRTPSPTIVYVGRLVAHKRLHLLLDAVAQLRERWPGLRVNIVGAGPVRSRLERLAQRLGLADVVTFSGWVSDEQRDQLLASGWMLVTPSAGEGWGLTVIEANAVGRPALAFRVPGLINSIAEGVNGWLVDDVKDLPSALDARLRQLAQPGEFELLQAHCRQWADHFSWQRTAERMADVIERAQRKPVKRALAPRAGEPTDAATVVVLDATSGLEHINPALLPADLLSVDGRTLRVVLQGHDEWTAVASLESLGLSGHARVRVARAADLLFGLWDLQSK